MTYDNDAQPDDEARREIRDALLRYARGMDRRDLELVLSAFHPDATASHGHAVGGNAHDGWRRRLSGSEAPVDRVGIGDAAADTLLSAQHHITNHLVERDEGVAWSEAYFISYYFSERQGRTYLSTVGGRYIDRFERRAGSWKIANRVSVHDWDRVEEVLHRFPNGESWAWGRSDRSDPSYAR